MKTNISLKDLHLNSPCFLAAFVTFEVVVFLLFLSSLNSEMASTFQHDITDMDAKIVASTVNKFTTSLFKVVSELVSSTENVLVAPFSVFIGLAMIRVGAKGKTLEQLNAALQLKEDTYINMLQLFQNLKVTGNSTLDLPNRIYIAHKCKLMEEFQSYLMEFFKSSSKLIDFGEINANEIINSWVEEQTHNKIKNLIPTGALNSLTQIVMVNAVYFKGSWLQKFDDKLTTKAPFFVGAGKQMVEVPMMHIYSKFYVGELPELDARILEMPYEGEALSMFIILPNQKDGLHLLEGKLFSGNMLQELPQLMQSAKLHVAVPKFKIESAAKMNIPLMKLGVLDLFDEKKADLSGISGVNDLYVSDIFHKAFLEINEEGSEAAAATATVIRLKRSLEVDEEPFIVDHPCLLALQHKATSLWLFISRLSIPTKWSSATPDQKLDRVEL